MCTFSSLALFFTITKQKLKSIIKWMDSKPTHEVIQQNVFIYNKHILHNAHTLLLVLYYKQVFLKVIIHFESEDMYN